MGTKFFEELSRCLGKEQIESLSKEDRRLEIFLHGQPVLSVSPGNEVFMLPSGSKNPEANELYHRVAIAADRVFEYVEAMENTPLLRARGLDNKFHLLADFGGAVLAGRERGTGRGYEFVTWIWDYERVGVSHGHYYEDDFAGAKRDFAVRSGLIPKASLFSNEELTEIYQCVVVTHMNTAHIHNHIIMNSVNFKNGQKFHQSAREMQQAKEYSNQLCREYGLSFTESKADPFRIPAWKKRLCRTIKEAMENCATREEFIAFMAEYGYKVRWEPNQKYITYTTPENVRCRDNKLFDQTLLRSSMEVYFDMGGCEYLESRIDATEYGELLPTVDDAVCGLISILDAMNTGDNDRFHLETLHHSKQEIRRILERGGKIDRTVEYAVDDEDEEYEQYHGFSMRM